MLTHSYEHGKSIVFHVKHGAYSSGMVRRAIREVPRSQSDSGFGRCNPHSSSSSGWTRWRGGTRCASLKHGQLPDSDAKSYKEMMRSLPVRPYCGIMYQLHSRVES